MSKAVVFGVTGYAGGHIANELLDRGHTVVGVARHAEKIAPRDGLAVRQGSLDDAGFVADAARGADLVVVAIPAHREGAPDLVDDVPALLDAAAAAGARLGVVGGAGSLRVSEGGPRVLDSGFPDAFRPEAEAHARVLDALREADTNVDWFYFSPAGGFGSFNPGRKTGKYRLGGDVLVTDADGKSEISGADYAVAFVDEVERPQHHKERFTAAY